MSLDWEIIKHFPLPWLFVDSVTFDLNCQPGRRAYNKLTSKFGAYRLNIASELLWHELADNTIELWAKNFTTINPVTIKQFVCLFEDLPADELERVWDST